MSGKEHEKNQTSAIRRDYDRDELVVSNVDDDPIDQFMNWFDQALAADLPDPNAMTLSTATEQGIPSSRIVLFKGVDENGFRFYSNYNSRKGRELEANPHAALCFFWAELERQVRVEGGVTKLSRRVSETYFHQRPRLSQLGAWASKQSSRVESRKMLENQFKKVAKKFKNKEIPLPDFWGGYLLKPAKIEFWQGRTGRLHDRLCYEREGGYWKILRLSP